MERKFLFLFCSCLFICSKLFSCKEYSRRQMENSTYWMTDAVDVFTSVPFTRLAIWFPTVYILNFVKQKYRFVRIYGFISL